MPPRPKALPAVTAAIAAPETPPKAFGKTIEGLKQNAETASSMLMTSLDQAQTKINLKIKQGVTRAMTTAEQLAQFHQGNMEAMVKSGQIWATGFQDMSKHMASQAQTTMEETISTFRAMTGVKSLKEAIDLQTSFARSSMEKVLSEGTKLTETSLKLAEQAAAPITARVNAAVEVFTNRA